MKKLLYILGVYSLSISPIYAQDVVYLNDQTQKSGKLIEVTAEKVALSVSKGESSIKFSYGIDRVVAVVSQQGWVLCSGQFKTMTPDERDRRINQFLTATNPRKYDVIIQAIPPKAIYGTVSYAQGDVVNYTTLNGDPASIPKSDLIGIFYRAGKHELFNDISFLCDNPTLLDDETSAGMSKTPAPVEQNPVADNTDWEKPTVSTPVPSGGATLQLTENQLREYQSQGLERVQEFAIMLGVIADKNTEAGQKDKAIAQVLKMFKPDASIQISSMTRGGVANTYRLKDYLIRLKLLPYKSVVLEWSDIQYVEELTQKDDGNYYGKIKGEQRFSGLNGQGDVQYGDVTQKDVDVILKPYKKKQEGVNEQKWAILLGNVGVTATQ